MAATSTGLKACSDCGIPHRPATTKQLAFVEHYPIKLDATDAARQAGYSEKSCSKIGYELLQNPGVQCALSRVIEDRRKKARIEAAYVLGELFKLADFDPLDVFEATTGRLKDISEIPERARKAISSIETKSLMKDGSPVVVTNLRFHSKTQALQLLGQHLKLYTQIVEHKTDNIRERIAAGRERARNGANGHGSHDGVPMTQGGQA